MGFTELLDLINRGLEQLMFFLVNISESITIFADSLSLQSHSFQNAVLSLV